MRRTGGAQEKTEACQVQASPCALGAGTDAPPPLARAPPHQGMRKLKEPAAIVRCRQVDSALVQGALEPARTQFAAAFKEEAPALTLDSTTFLPPPTQTGKEEEASRCVPGARRRCVGGRGGGLVNVREGGPCRR